MQENEIKINKITIDTIKKKPIKKTTHVPTACVSIPIKHGI